MYKKIIVGSMLFMGCSSTNNIDTKQTINNSINQHLQEDNLFEKESSYFVTIQHPKTKKKRNMVKYA